MNFKIHNCMRALDDSQKLIEESLKQLQNANTSITNDLNELLNRGWKDKNYENLKNVLLKCENFYVGFVTEHESDDENGFLEVLGRFDHSDLRGCNLLVQ